MKSIVYIFSALVFVFSLFVGNAYTLELGKAKETGLVGETYTGYIEAVTNTADAQVNKLVQEINAKRRAEYARIAAKNRTEVGAVEALAGQKAMAKTPTGQYIKKADGVWKRK